MNQGLQRHRFLLATVAVLFTALLASTTARAITFPRIGLSAASDHLVNSIDVSGDEEFQLYVLVLPPEDATLLPASYTRFSWAVLQACCDGAVEIVDEQYDAICHHTGSALGGVDSTSDTCLGGDYLHLATLTFRFLTDQTGLYYLIAGPLNYAQDCEGQNVVFTDMTVEVHYAGGSTPVAPTSWGSVKALFED